MPPNVVHARIRAGLISGKNVLTASTVLPWVISSIPHKTVDTADDRFGMAQTSANRMEQIMMYKPTYVIWMTDCNSRSFACVDVDCCEIVSFEYLGVCLDGVDE